MQRLSEADFRKWSCCSSDLFIASKVRKNISDVLNKELQAIKEKVKYMNITIEKTVKRK